MVCDDQTTSPTLLPVFTGCVHLNASSLNWQSLSTEVFTAVHLGLSDLLHRVSDITSRRRLRSSTSSELVIPLSRIVTVGDRSFAVALAPGSGTLCLRITCAPSLLVFQRKLKTHFICFDNLVRTVYCSLCGLLRPVVLKVFTYATLKNL